MAIAVATTRQALADAYKNLGAYFGCTTGNPGTSSTPANEASGGSPAYARKAITWVSGTGGALSVSAPAVCDVPAGTFTHIIFCSGASGANQLDNADVADVIMNNQGQVVITPAFSLA
jgi:hypothetical protein